MELWLVFGILGYLAFAISTSIDKFIMKYRIGAIRTDTFKMFFDGTVLLVIGLLFFDLEFTFSTFAWALLLGVFYGFQGILYFTLLEVRDAEDLIPNFQALRILLIFVGSIVIFSEPVSILNYFGVIVILGGIYTLVSEDGLKFPKFQKGSSLIILMTISNVIYSLLLKKLLFNFKPINLAIMMYFSTTLILLLYQVIFRKKPLRSVVHVEYKFFKILVSSLFAASGTLLLYLAVSLGNASKVYPMAGLNSVFMFVLATIFLKEKFYWHRLFGIILVVAGIALVSI